MTAALPRFLGALQKVGRVLEDAVLVTLLGGLIGLAASQIILRNLFDTGFVWADELLRILVLWVALVGAIAASRDDRHIRIDILSRFLSERPRLAAVVIVDLFTACISAVVAWFAARFLMDSYEYQDTLVGGLPAWPFQLVLPVAFGLIAYRYFIFCLLHLIQLIRGVGEP